MNWGECWSRCEEMEPRMQLGMDGKEFVRKQEAWNNWLSEIAQRFEADSVEDIAWFERALAAEGKKWFACSVLSKLPQIPDALFAPLIQAAVREHCPSNTRAFVAPAVHAFGSARVIEALRPYAEHGTREDKDGAQSALYWAPLLSPAEEQPAQGRSLLKSILSRIRALFG